MTDFKQDGTHFGDASLPSADIIKGHSRAAGAVGQWLATEETVVHKQFSGPWFGQFFPTDRLNPIGSRSLNNALLSLVASSINY